MTLERKNRAEPWSERIVDSYGLILALLIVVYVLLVSGVSGTFLALVQIVLLTATLLLTLRTSAVHGRILRVAQIAAGVGLLIGIVDAFKDSNPETSPIVWIVAGGLLAICPIAIMARILRHPHVTVETILGAICVYVLLGLLSAAIYLAVDGIQSNPFFVQSGPHPPADYLYFSLVTLTTTGYGDLTASSGVPRAIVTSEALAGQIFLVTLVARLVGLYSSEHRRIRNARTDAESQSGGETV